jgi:hypothetical protein
MRHLLQPQVLKLSVIAGLVSALAAYPRLGTWSNRSAPVWYLEATIFFCTVILWGFVFAWHTRYTGRPVFVFKVATKPFIVVTLLGILMGMVYHQWFDPSLRTVLPKEYPADVKSWFAFSLFTLAVNQLFLIFAAFAWFIRLTKNLKLTVSLTALLGAFVLALKIGTLPTSPSLSLLVALLLVRIAAGFLAVGIYLRGGVISVWWWTLLFQARLLLDFINHP